MVQSMRDRLWRNRSGHFKGCIIGGLSCTVQVAAIAGLKSGLISLLLYLPAIPLFAWLDHRLYPQAKS